MDFSKLYYSGLNNTSEMIHIHVYMYSTVLYITVYSKWTYCVRAYCKYESWFILRIAFMRVIT